jgi:hypothetical protein
MSTLRSALAEFRFSDVRALGNEQLASDLDELEHAERVIHSERSKRIAEIERRGSYAVDGHPSVASWLMSRHRIAPSLASGHARLARRLERMPVAKEALAAGEVSSSAITVLAAAQDACPEQFARSEKALVDAARSLPIDQLVSTVADWRDSRGVDSADEHQELYVSPTLAGRGRVGGDLNAETTQTLITALRAVLDAETRSSDPTDTRSPARRRADALGEICRQWLKSHDRPTVAGERPHVIVTVDVETLHGRDGKGSELADVGPIPAEEALLWACDADVTRVITDARSRPLDVGRTTRTTPSWLRRALIVRDRGCAFPRCGRPPSWTDAHHVRHWGEGGRTALGNLVLLCRRHHRLIHHRTFSVEIVDDLPLFRRGDGSILEAANRAPP